MPGSWQDIGKDGAGNEPTPKVVVTIEIFDWAPGQSRLMWKADPVTRATPDYSPQKVMETVIREAGRAL